MSKMNDEAEIRTVLEDRAKAIRDKNADSVVSHYADDILVFELPPPLSFGAAEALDKSGQEKWFRTWRGAIGWEMRDLRVMAGDAVAFAYTLCRLSGTKVDSEEVDMWVRQTVGFCKIDGRWKSRMSIRPCPSTWTAASGRRSTSSHSASQFCGAARSIEPQARDQVLQSRIQPNSAFERTRTLFLAACVDARRASQFRRSVAVRSNETLNGFGEIDIRRQQRAKS